MYAIIHALYIHHVSNELLIEECDKEVYVQVTLAATNSSWNRKL